MKKKGTREAHKRYYGSAFEDKKLRAHAHVEAEYVTQRKKRADPRQSLQILDTKRA